MNSKYISIGKIINFHGIMGELKVGYTKGKEHQLLNEKVFYIHTDNDYKELHVVNLRFNKNTALIKFSEINSINEAVEYKGHALFIPVENLRDNLEEDEFLVDDLIGLDAYNTNNELIGKITCINKQTNSDLLCITNNENKEFLVPFVKALVPNVNIAEKKVVINAIEGLLD